MKRSLNDYDQSRGGGGSRGDNFAKDMMGRAGLGVGASASLYGAGKFAEAEEKAAEQAKREADSEMQRETRGVKKPANFDAMQESIQEAKDAAARKKISGMGYSKGGSVGSASKRADGIATKGKTKGTMVKMNYGGKC
jgi:hypothetical protein